MSGCYSEGNREWVAMSEYKISNVSIDTFTNARAWKDKKRKESVPKPSVLLAADNVISLLIGRLKMI